MQRDGGLNGHTEEEGPRRARVVEELGELQQDEQKRGTTNKVQARQHGVPTSRWVGLEVTPEWGAERRGKEERWHFRHTSFFPRLPLLSHRCWSVWPDCPPTTNNTSKYDCLSPCFLIPRPSSCSDTILSMRCRTCLPLLEGKLQRVGICVCSVSPFSPALGIAVC